MKRARTCSACSAAGRRVRRASQVRPAAGHGVCPWSALARRVSQCRVRKIRVLGPGPRLAIIIRIMPVTVTLTPSHLHSKRKKRKNLARAKKGRLGNGEEAREEAHARGGGSLGQWRGAVRGA
jgi:hypothetical protein